MNKNTAYRIYKNDEIEIHWERVYCTHVAECFTRLLSVFDPGRRPWIDPYGASTPEIIDVINACPTRALTFRWLDEAKNATETSPKLRKMNGTPPDTIPGVSKTTITLRPNGPMLVNGDFELLDTNGEKLPTMKMVSLCRCGESSSMPFCDGAHFKIGFRG